MSNWSKMTEDEKKAYYAKRQERRAAKKAKNANEAKKAVKAESVKKAVKAESVKKALKAVKAEVVKHNPEKVVAPATVSKDALKREVCKVVDEMARCRCGNDAFGTSLSEDAAVAALSRACLEHEAVERAVRRIGNALVDLMGAFRPDVDKISFERSCKTARVEKK